MSQFLQFFYLTVIPVFIMFLIERLSLRYLIRAPWGKDWVRSKFWLHPNFISRCRYPMGVISVIFFHMGFLLGGDAGDIQMWRHVGIINFSFWIITDMTDGTIARYFDLHTEEGKSIDPLSDKLLLFPPLFYFAYLGFYDYWIVAVFLIFDLIGQFSRYFIKNTAANLFGKAKSFLTVITIVLLTVQIVYYDSATLQLSVTTLWGAAALGFFSMFFKIVPNYWYANILSILNFACGIAGIVLVLIYDQPGLGFAAVFFGQFLDLFDGRAADKWGSTPRGEIFDDIADGTNFGGTIALIIYVALGRTEIALGLAILHLAFTLYRLYRFIANKRKANIEGGVEIFEGFPSPAAALISGSIAMSNGPMELKIIIIFLTSILMITKVPYFHFGRVFLPKVPKILKASYLTLLLVTILTGFSTNNHQLIYWFVFCCASVYLVFGIKWKKTLPETTKEG